MKSTKNKSKLWGVSFTRLYSKKEKHTVLGETEAEAIENAKNGFDVLPPLWKIEKVFEPSNVEIEEIIRPGTETNGRTNANN